MLISVLSPVFNEVNNVDRCAEAVAEVFKGLPDFTYEHIFADNNSTDGTQSKLETLAMNDPEHIKVIFNAENVGGERSMLNAAYAANGDYIMACIAADLQDPPSIIPKMLAFIDPTAVNNPDIIAGARTNRAVVEGKFFNWAKTVGYNMMDKLSKHHIPAHVGIHLISNQVLRRIENELGNHRPFLRATLPEFKEISHTIYFEWTDRIADKGKTNFWSLVSLGLYGFRVILFGPKKMPPVPEIRRINL